MGGREKSAVRRLVGRTGPLVCVVLVTATVGLPGAAQAALPASPTASLDGNDYPHTVFPGPYNTYPGGTSQQASTLDMRISNDFSAGDTITVPIEVGSPPAPNTGGADQAVSLDSAQIPNVSFSGGSSSDTTPTFTVVQATNPADSQAVKDAGLADELVITFTDSAAGPLSDTWTLSTVLNYVVGSAAAAGSNGVPVDVAPFYTSGPSSEPFNASPTAPAGTPVVTAFIQHYTVDEPPFGVLTSGLWQAIPDFVFTEGVPGLLHAGGHWLTANGATLGGTATVSATGMTVGVPDGGGNCPASGSTSVTVSEYQGAYVFCVVHASDSSTGPGTLTVSGMTLAPPSTAGPVRLGIGDGTTWFQTPQPAVTAIDGYRVAGQTADDTAATAATDPAYKQQMNGGSGGAVLLASDAEYQDALAASFLGHAPLGYQNSSGGTSTMTSALPLVLNPPVPPSGGESATAAVGAIKALHASTVYVIGGTYAISPEVVDELQQVQIGSLSSGGPEYLHVVRIAGYTAEQTAAQVAEYPTGMDMSLSPTPAAYGLYNSGASESAAPPSPSSGGLRTAILADDSEFQDALAASPLSYGAELPILLNPDDTGLDPDTSAAITRLGVQQVIVVGGSSAVRDQTVNDLIAKGVGVLRIAGTSYPATAVELASFILNGWVDPSAHQAPQDVAGLGSEANASPYGMSGTTVTVGTSRGDAFQDALSAAQILGHTGKYGVSPLLLTAGPDVLPAVDTSILEADGTAPNGGSIDAGPPRSILGLIVVGGTYAQTPGLVQAEMNAVARG